MDALRNSPLTAEAIYCLEDHLTVSPKVRRGAVLHRLVAVYLEAAAAFDLMLKLLFGARCQLENTIHAREGGHHATLRLLPKAAAWSERVMTRNAGTGAAGTAGRTPTFP